MNTGESTYDVLIVGGSYAGLSAAMVLGRSLRRVVVIDADHPANRQTPHAHGFLTRDGETPAQLAAIAREQVRQYPSVRLETDTVVRAARQDGQFVVTTANGQFTSRRLLLATGIIDIMPSLPGFAECWGRSVLHCPYCHGYEVHGQPVGVLGNGDVGYDMATLIQHWNPGLTLFTNGPAQLTEPQRDVLNRLTITVNETPIAALNHVQGSLDNVQFTDGQQLPLTALYARVPFQQSPLVEQLGLALTEHGFIQATEFGETNVPGLYAAGDATTMMRQLAVAVANGSKAAAWMNKDLLADDMRKRLKTDLAAA